jgi:CRP-like cAMP-binding protein|tara:strand:- start:553 stop:891 length:339 start_codon:yes stop_codon:yes gene_type:complete
MERKKVNRFFMLLLTKELLRTLKRNLGKKSNKYYTPYMDKKTEKRVQGIINDTRTFVQGQVDQGVNLVELAQVMLAMSRETIVDAYGEDVADSYIANQISRLQKYHNSITFH